MTQNTENEPSPHSYWRSGVMLVDKPEGLSSAAVVAKIKKKFQFDKIGHGGTLDPFASGLLVLLVGEATKISRFLLSGEKAYECEAMIGHSTTTGDHTGEIKNTALTTEMPSLDIWKKTKKSFLGKIQQVPPQYSAIKVQGKAMYKYAREGEVVDLSPREVEIFELAILEQDASKNASDKKLLFHVRCGGGTYIRSLAEDWAHAAGTEAHLTKLRRTQSSEYEIKNAHTLAELLDWQAPKPPLVPLHEALKKFPSILLTPEQTKWLRHGNLTNIQAPEIVAQPTPQTQDFYFIAITPEKIPLAILKSQPNEANKIQIERIFVFDPPAQPK